MFLGLTLTVWGQASLMLLGGNLGDHRAPDPGARLLEQHGRLRVPLGAYAIRGNHEYLWRGDQASFQADLADLGVPS